MNERQKQFRVGVVAIATVVITAILITWHSDFSALPFQSRYQVQLLVNQAPGVAPNTPVRRRGLLIGRVDSVEARDDGALITLGINDGEIIKSNEEGRIQASLIGDAVIEFVPVRPPQTAQPIEPGGQVAGVYNPTPLDMLGEIQGDLRQTIISLGQAGQEVSELANRLNTVLGGNDLQRIATLVESLDRAVNQFAEVMESVDEIVGDRAFQDQIKAGLAQLPSLVGDIRAIFVAVEGAVGSADQNLKNLQGLTGPLGDRGPAIVDRLEGSAQSLQETLAEVAALTHSVNNSEGTVGMLIRDRTLYDQTSGTMAQASAAIQDARMVIANFDVMIRRWRPVITAILDDVRIITDKVARDPARVARGVLNRETPIK
ncbi:MAG: MCE family protein [Planctomycetales bacterium]|nr:MCE family protein [Planctomycetales bacterium]